MYLLKFVCACVQFTFYNFALIGLTGCMAGLVGALFACEWVEAILWALFGVGALWVFTSIPSWFDRSQLEKVKAKRRK